MEKFIRTPIRFTLSPMVGIGLLGLLVRLIYLWSAGADPSALHPLVDAKTYHDLASRFAETGWTEKFIWQATFYPAFLTFVYQVFGVSVFAAKLIQAVLGAVSCALTYRLGRVIGGHRVGLGAGLILAFCGPVFFFESRLMATGWAVFWTVALALLLLRNLSRPRVGSLIIMGCALALAVYTRPTFLTVGLVVVVMLLLPGRPDATGFGRRMANVGLVAAGFALVVGPVSAFFLSSTGHLGLIPPSGGINLFVGNNADYETTINIRPGLVWDDLVAEPARHGFDPDPWGGDRYFKREVRRFAVSEPGRFAGGLVSKALTLLSSREIPRNLDIYLHCQWSPMLSWTTWRVGAWGFPLGLIMPFALVGLLRSSGRKILVIRLLTGVMALSLVLVFVASRYRVPLMPLLAVLAAQGVGLTVLAVRQRCRREILVIGALLVGGVILSTAPGPFVQESVDLEAELYFGVAEGYYDRQDWPHTVAMMERSLALDAEVHASHQIMGIALASLHQYDRAMHHFEQAVRLRPGHVATLSNLAQCRKDRARAGFVAARKLELQDPSQAIRMYRQAAKDAPSWYKPRAREALVAATTAVDSVRSGGQAVVLARQAIQLRGEPDPYLQYVLAAALAEAGQFEAATATANGALELVTMPEDDGMALEIRRAIVAFTERRPLRK